MYVNDTFGRQMCQEWAVTHPPTKAEQREATVEKLLDVARRGFGEHGFAHTSTEEIVRASGVTRGALYYHFKNKEGLFKAVFDQLQREIAHRIEHAANQSPDPAVQLRLGCRAFLETALHTEVRRVVLIDAPAVLGWAAWREADAAHAMRSLRQALQALGVEPLDAATHALSGAMNETALWTASHPRPDVALEEADVAIQRLLDALVSPL